MIFEISFLERITLYLFAFLFCDIFVWITSIHRFYNWIFWDSNPGRAGYEPGALPTELKVRKNATPFRHSAFFEEIHFFIWGRRMNHIESILMILLFFRTLWDILKKSLYFFPHILIRILFPTFWIYSIHLICNHNI